MSRRILNHPVLGKVENNRAVTFTFNNKEYTGYENESIAAALLANGIRTLRYHEENKSPRGVYCNIGHCFECRVIVNGKQGVRACLTPLKENIVIESHGALPTPLKDRREENE